MLPSALISTLVMVAFRSPAAVAVGVGTVVEVEVGGGVVDVTTGGVVVGTVDVVDGRVVGTDVLVCAFC